MIYITKIPESLQQGDVLQNLPKITPNQINFEKVKGYWLKSINSNSLPEKSSFIVKPMPVNGIILSHQISYL
ncbi:hypothetical protein ES705_30171 [subsurface metagenome]